MNRPRGKASHRIISLLVAFALAGTPAFSIVPYAHAAMASENAASSAAASGQQTSSSASIPAGAVEVPERRTAYATHYRLPDGTYSCELSAGRVHYKAADGSWQNIDSSLVPSATPGISRNGANDVQLEFANTSTGRQPVHIAGDGWTFDMAPLFGLVGCQVDLGHQARFLSVAADTDIEYESGPDGMKETLLLHSASAPSAFSFKLSFSGLSLRGSGADWALYRPGSFTPQLTLGDLYVEDSAAQPVAATGATMTVLPTQNGAIVTCSVPQSWLSDPARVFPVKVDPSVWWGPNADTFVDSYYGTTKYGSAGNLKVGDSGTSEVYRSFIKFDISQSGLPENAYPGQSTLRLYSDPNSTAQNGFAVGTVNTGSSWSEASTCWNNQPAHGPALCTQNVPAHGAVYGVQWTNAAITSTVLDWYWHWFYNGNQTNNNGFAIWRTTTGARLFQNFHSRQAASSRPQLGIGYITPSVSVSTNKTVVHADDSEIVQATVTVWPSYNNIAVDLFSSAPGHGGIIDFVWDGGSFPTDPYVYRPAPTGGNFGVSSRSLPYVTPLMDRWSVTTSGDGSTKYYTFAWKVKPGYGDVQAAGLQAIATIGTGYEKNKSYLADGPSQNVLPGPVSMNCDSNKSSEVAGGWWTQPDANGDGIADGGNDTTSTGRGNVNLDWKPLLEASGYKIYLHDGNAWQQVGSTTGSTATTWTTEGKRFFPTDSTIASLPAGYTGNPFTPGSGVDLRDDPSVLYAKMGSSARALETHYRFKVVPCSSAGDAYSPIDPTQPEFLATIPNRTVYANPDERHTTCDLGSAAHHDTAGQLDDGALSLSVTDLSIASFGPAAELSRSYDSLDPGTGTFAPGWRFNFEQSIETTSGFATYVDEEGQRHRFVASGSTYIPPRGFAGSLTTSGTGWALTLIPEHRTLKFDGAGKLAFELDDNNNAVNYVWTDADHLSIYAANGQSIDVTLVGGKVSSARYAPAGAPAREVEYSVGDPVSTARYFPGTADDYTAQYAYANGRLSELYVPSGYFESAGNYAARWGYDYDASGRLSTVRLPGCGEVSANRCYAIDYGTDGVTATIHTPTDDSRGVIEEWGFNADGTPASRTSPRFAGDSAHAWRSWQDAMLEDARETSPLGHETRNITDLHGNTRAEVNQTGAATTYAYDASDRVSVKTDPSGSTTTYTYNGATNDVSTETRLLASDGKTSVVRYSYDSTIPGVVTAEAKTISDPSVFVTTAQYSGFALNGEWQTKTVPGVQFFAGDGNHDVTESRTFDPFGNTLSETDASGTVTARTTYSVSGRALVSTDAAGAVTHHLYDSLGDEIETSRTAGVDFTGWSRKTIDPLGRTLLETILSDGGETDHTLTHVFDAAGHETASVHSIEGTTTSAYDAAGNLTISTPPVGGSSRSVYDDDGRKYEDYGPGAANATVSELDAAGRETKVTQPDGSWTSWTYDLSGNKTSETKPVQGGGTNLTVRTYDLGGRQLTETKNAGSIDTAVWPRVFLDATTSFTYDLAGRQLSAGLADQGASTKTYNVLDWELSSTDSDGIQTTTRYDACGRTVATTTGTSTTTTDYDSSGRTTAVHNPDGSAAYSRYDAFGRAVEETQTKAGGGMIKHTLATYDALGRATNTTETISGVTSRFEYAAGSSKASTATVTYAETTTTVSYAASGLENSRTSVVGGVSASRGSYVRDGANRTTSWNVGGIAQGGRALYNDAGKMTSQGGYGWDATATYTYDPATGRKTAESLAPSFGGSWSSSYAYRTDGRLSGATIGGASTFYAYDVSGNLVQFGSLGATTTLAYDADNRLASRALNGVVNTTYAFDARGRRTAQGSISYTYDSSDHLVHYHDGSRSIEATFAYDARGQRTHSSLSNAGVSTETTYTYDGLNLLSLSAVSGSTTYTISYLFDENSRPYAAAYHGSDTTATRVFHLVTTDRGDVIELLTDSGSPFASYRYDAWGNPTSAGSQAAGSIAATLAATIASRQPLRYATYAYDAFSGLYYLSARYYDPATMQFITKDPAEADGEESAYQYCGGEPVEHTDSSGLMIDDAYLKYNQTVRPHEKEYKSYIKEKRERRYRRKNTRWRLDRCNLWVNYFRAGIGLTGIGLAKPGTGEGGIDVPINVTVGYTYQHHMQRTHYGDPEEYWEKVRAGYYLYRTTLFLPELSPNPVDRNSLKTAVNLAAKEHQRKCHPKTASKVVKVRTWRIGE